MSKIWRIKNLAYINWIFKSIEDVINFLILHKHLNLDRKQLKDKKLLPYQQMLPRLPILLAQVKADDTSNNFFKRIEKFFYDLYGQQKSIYKYNEFNIDKIWILCS